MAHSNSTSSKFSDNPLYIRYASVVIVLIGVVYISYVLQDVIVPLAFAMLISIFLHPICELFEKWRIHRILAIVLSIILSTVVLLGISYLAIMQMGNFADAIPNITEKAEKFLEATVSWGEQQFNISRNEQISQAKKYLINILSESRDALLNTLVSTGGALGTIALIPLYVFFFLLYRDFFRLFIYKAFSRVSHEKLDVVLGNIYSVIKSYMVGLALVIIIVGILNSVGLLLLGVEYAIFFGFFAAVLILIPYIGILIGSIIPAALTLVTNDNPWAALGVIGVMAFVQFLEGNFITPNIVGSKVSVNPLAAIVMLLLVGQLWGIAGMILALPLTATLKVILDSHKHLEPYGFLLGEPGMEVEEEEKARQEALIKKDKKTQKEDNSDQETT